MDQLQVAFDTFFLLKKVLDFFLSFIGGGGGEGKGKDGAGRQR